MIGRTLVLASAMIAATGCGSPGNAGGEPRVTMLAAASAVSALDGIVADYEAAHGVEITVSYAASATLAKQIIAGADADVFLSASTEWTDEVAKSRPVLERDDTLGNRLVLVAPAARAEGVGSAADLAVDRVTRIAIGDPESVPAGAYAREALMTLGVWERVQPKLVYTLDVRQALLYAELGEVDAAIVYASDAAESEKVVVVQALDSALKSPVRYSLVLLGTGENAAAREFFEYLLSAEATARFEAAGFERVAGSANTSGL